MSEIKTFEELVEACENLTNEKVKDTCIFRYKNGWNVCKKDKEFNCYGFRIVYNFYEKSYRIVEEPCHDIAISNNPQKIYDVIKAIRECGVL